MTVFVSLPCRKVTASRHHRLGISRYNGKVARLIKHPQFLLLAIFLISVLPAVFQLTTHSGGDEMDHTYPTILAMAANWPRVSPYQVPEMGAYGPLYSYLFSALPMRVIHNLTLLKLINSLFSLVLLWIIYRHLAAFSRNPWVAFVLSVPIVCSQSFQLGAIWLMTHNLALLFLVYALFVPLRRVRPDGITAFASALGGALAVATRQTYALIGIPLALSLWSSSKGEKPGRCLRDILLVVFALAAPLGVLGILFYRWGGVVPPAYQEQDLGTNWSAIPFALGLLGGYSLILAPVLRPDWKVFPLSRSRPCLLPECLSLFFPTISMSRCAARERCGSL